VATEFIEEENERKIHPKNAIIKMCLLIMIPIFAVETPLYFWVFGLISMEQAVLFMGMAGCLTAIPIIFIWHFETGQVTGKLFFKPFVYWKRPGYVLEEDQAQIKGRITPIREESLSALSLPGNPVDDEMKRIEQEKGIKVGAYMLEGVLNGKTFAEMAAELGLKEKKLQKWWEMLGGFEKVEDIRPVLQYPYRYLIEFEDLANLDATILCSKVPFTELGIPQERDDVLYKGYFVKARAIPISLHELRAFTYAGVKMSVTIPLACDKAQAEIQESAGEYNIPQPDVKLAESAVSDYDKGYVGILLKREVEDLEEHVTSLLKADKDREARILELAEKRYQLWKRTGKKPGRLSSLSRRSKIFLITVITLAAIIVIVNLIYMGVFG